MCTDPRPTRAGYEVVARDSALTVHAGASLLSDVSWK